MHVLRTVPCVFAKVLMENLVINQELLKLVIVSFILVT